MGPFCTRNNPLAFDDHLFWYASSAVRASSLRYTTLSLPQLETRIGALRSAGYHSRNLRCYMLYNHYLPFDVVAEKLKVFERLRFGPAHSRFRPSTVLCDGYVSLRKEGHGDDEYYIHTGWSDRQVRIIRSLTSDISRMARGGVDSPDEVRRYYGNQASRRPSHLRRRIGTLAFCSGFSCRYRYQMR